MDGGIPAGWILGAFPSRLTDSTVSGARQSEERVRGLAGLTGEETEQGFSVTLQLKRTCSDRSLTNIREEAKQVAMLGSLPTTGALAFLVEWA